MKEYSEQSVLSTISTSCSKMGNARCISLAILLYNVRGGYRLQYLILGVPLERRSIHEELFTNTNRILFSTHSQDDSSGAWERHKVLQTGFHPHSPSRFDNNLC